MKIITSFVYPPIPVRNFDWAAFDDDTYDGPGSLVGHGPTEEAAIADFKESWELHHDKDFPEVGRTAGEYGNDEIRWPDGLQHY